MASLASPSPFALLLLLTLASTVIHAFSVNFSKFNPSAAQNDATAPSKGAIEASSTPKLPTAPSSASEANAQSALKASTFGLISRNQRKRSCCCCNCCCCKCCPCCCCCPCQCGESCWKWTPCCCCPCCCGCVGYGRRKMMRCRRNATAPSAANSTAANCVVSQGPIQKIGGNGSVPAKATICQCAPVKKE